MGGWPYRNKQNTWLPHAPQQKTWLQNKNQNTWWQKHTNMVATHKTQTTTTHGQALLHTNHGCNKQNGCQHIKKQNHGRQSPKTWLPTKQTKTHDKHGCKRSMVANKTWMQQKTNKNMVAKQRQHMVDKQHHMVANTTEYHGCNTTIIVEQHKHMVANATRQQL